MDDLLKCSICFEKYDDHSRVPRQLPCQHSYCSLCLVKLKKRHQPTNIEYLQCPTCRKEFYKHLDDMPKSLLILQLIDAIKSTGGTAMADTEIASTSFSTTMSAPFSMPLATPTPMLHGESIQWNEHSYKPLSSHAPPVPPQMPPAPVHHPPPPPPPVWDLRTYLHTIFNEMDTNRDGSITAVELQEALRRSQSGSQQFSLKTVELLVSKYDTDGNREIDFQEFQDLFTNLNEEFESFLLMDADGSGSVDAGELTDALAKKGYRFSAAFYRWMIDEVARHTGASGIEFDNYIRIAARFDYLCQSYRRTPYFQKDKLEKYLSKTFFQDFW